MPVHSDEDAFKLPDAHRIIAAENPPEGGASQNVASSGNAEGPQPEMIQQFPAGAV